MKLNHSEYEEVAAAVIWANDTHAVLAEMTRDGQYDQARIMQIAEGLRSIAERLGMFSTPWPPHPVQQANRTSKGYLQLVKS
jgi:hypothetical protein